MDQIFNVKGLLVVLNTQRIITRVGNIGSYGELHSPEREMSSPESLI